MIQYRLRQEPSPDADEDEDVNLFEINADTGRITTVSKLDRESVSSYKLIVEAVCLNSILRFHDIKDNLKITSDFQEII